MMTILSDKKNYNESLIMLDKSNKEDIPGDINSAEKEKENSSHDLEKSATDNHPNESVFVFTKDNADNKAVLLLSESDVYINKQELSNIRRKATS